MNRGVSESSPVLQQLMTAGNPDWWKASSDMRPPPPLMGHQLGSLPPQMTHNNDNLRHRMMPTLLPHYLPYPATSSSPSLLNNPNLSSWLERNDLPPESWSLSQLLLGGLMMGEEERLEIMNHHNHHDGEQHHSFQGKMRLENWEEQVLSHQQASMGVTDIKQESIVNKNNGHHLACSPKSPLNKSCVTTTSTSLNSIDDNSNNNNTMFDFSSIHNGLNLSEGRQTPPDRSSECNSLEIGGSTNKKPRLQPSSSQSTFKVRKEKLGGRIAALHQLVSPFGKTDTASVLSEAIGYIRFLHSQIEALSHPYFSTTASGNMRHQQHLQGDRSCLFPEDPGQLVNDQCMKRKGVSSSSTDNQNANEEPKKDLRSRGLCLVPISCTLQVGSDNGADYCAPAFGSAGFQ